MDWNSTELGTIPRAEWKRAVQRMVTEEPEQSTPDPAGDEPRTLLRRYGLGCPRLQTEAAFRDWLVQVGRRFAYHLGVRSRATVLCHGWGRPWRRGHWFHPLVFTVGDGRLVFDLDLREMHSLGEAHVEQQLLASEQLYQGLERALRYLSAAQAPGSEEEIAEESDEIDPSEAQASPK